MLCIKCTLWLEVEMPTRFQYYTRNTSIEQERKGMYRKKIRSTWMRDTKPLTKHETQCVIAVFDAEFSFLFNMIQHISTIEYYSKRSWIEQNRFEFILVKYDEINLIRSYDSGQLFVAIVGFCRNHHAFSFKLSYKKS